jgi:DNA-directed RNA polymerase subunit RPC12/RpoP
MERSLNSWKSDDENRYSREAHSVRCGECGEEFDKPLLAKISSAGQVQSYYACPRCLTEVSEPREQRSEKSEESPVSLKGLKEVSAKLEENVSCQHFFGYLKKRPKDSSIPEDCLTCEKMIECMVR